MSILPSKPVSMYIHWPYCLSLCPYCDFNSHIGDRVDPEEWLASYIKEIDHFKEHIKGRYVPSIFFGGGTPSLMDPKIVAGAIEHIANICQIDENTEITLEANPTSYETEKFKSFKAAGVNRVSLGVQSLRDDQLARLGRKHSSKEAIEALKSASKIFDRYSFDLIYARPDQTLADWGSELKEALPHMRDHISLYQLTIEKGTPFYIEHRDGRLILPENEIAASMYELTREILTKKGLFAYEISNYSRQGAECRHNLAYWNYDEYVGIGPGAHSRLHKTNQDDDMSIHAIMMQHHPNKWMQEVNHNGHGIQKDVILSESELIEEILMMGLRLKEGMQEENLTLLTGKKFSDILSTKNLNIYVENDFVQIEAGNLSLTSKGLLVHSYIVPRLLVR